MKRFLLASVMAVMSLAAMAQRFSGGAAAENQLLLADPFILEEDGWYYIYGTHSPNGIVVYRSQDLKSWSDLCGNAEEGLALHKDDVWGDKWFWAPEVYRIGNKYLMTYSCQEHICYAESDSPCGPFVQKTQKPYLPQEKGIDSSIFIDDDGKPYMFWVRFTNGNAIWVAEMSDDLSQVKIETARHIMDAKEGSWEHQKGRVVEGPMVIKHKGKYYLTYSGNDFRSQDYAVGFAVAEKPMGPYERYEGNPILHRHMGYYGTGHHALFRKADGYYMVYHAHNSAHKVQTRQTLIAPLLIRRDKSKPKSEESYVLSVSHKLIIPKVAK